MNLFKNILCAKSIALILVIGIIPLKWSAVNAQVANVTVDIPAPHGGDLGLIAGGFAFQSRTRNTPKGFKPDGNIGLSVGLGDSRRLVGLTVGGNLYGLSNTIGEDDDFGSGSLDIQINRAISGYFFVGAGIRNVTKWRSQEYIPRNNRSYYFTSNYIIPFTRHYDKPFSLLFITAGVGNGIFRLDKDFDPRNSGKFNIFGSVALQVYRGTNVIFEWNGYEINTSLSVYPFKKIPALGGTFTLTDLTEQRTRFIVSMGYSFKI